MLSWRLQRRRGGAPILFGKVLARLGSGHERHGVSCERYVRIGWEYSRGGGRGKGAGRYILVADQSETQQRSEGVVAASWSLRAGRGDQPAPPLQRRGERKIALQVAGERQNLLRQRLQPLNGILGMRS